MNTDHLIPPLRNLPAERLHARREHLLSEIRDSERHEGARFQQRWFGPRRRFVALAFALSALVIGTAVAATTNGWLTGSPAPKAVAEDFGSYAPQLGFNPEPGHAVRVAQDGDILLYATTNKQGGYCLLASATWKRPSKLGEGGTCISPAHASAPLLAGLVGASSSADGKQIYLIAGRTTDAQARTIRFSDPAGTAITRPIGSSGFFIAAVRTDAPACATGDWEPRFYVQGDKGEERGSATITIGSTRAPGVCLFPTPRP